ncbi:MAG: ABC transporter ATP-binding protein [Anaerolineaceae bacterium]|nr:ABC transporter ATP-binding protein [Anaerolineaceae bacterium]
MLEVGHIDVFYGSFQVLRDVSIQVGDGDLVVLVGSNGHGKSTLLKAICGLAKPKVGTIIYNGTPINPLPCHKIVEMGLTYIAEDRELFSEMSVIENLKLGAFTNNARRQYKENVELVFQLFPKLSLLANRSALTLSGGEARMLAIGRGLMSSAKFLAIDEPSLGLAPNLRSEVYSTIQKIHERGISILLVEQSLPQVLEMATRVFLMEEGQIVFEGNREQARKEERLSGAYLVS